MGAQAGFPVTLLSTPLWMGEKGNEFVGQAKQKDADNGIVRCCLKARAVRFPSLSCQNILDISR